MTTNSTTPKQQIADAMREARAAFPMTIEFQDGKTMVIRRPRDVPNGIPYRIQGDADKSWVVKESL